MSLLPDPVVQAQQNTRNISYQSMYEHSKFLETIPIDTEINHRADEILSELNNYSQMKIYDSITADKISAEIYNKYMKDPLVTSIMNSKFNACTVPGWDCNSEAISKFHSHVSYFRNLVYTYRKGLKQEAYQKILEEEERAKKRKEWMNPKKRIWLEITYPFSINEDER